MFDTVSEPKKGSNVWKYVLLVAAVLGAIAYFATNAGAQTTEGKKVRVIEIRTVPNATVEKMEDEINRFKAGIDHIEAQLNYSAANVTSPDELEELVKMQRKLRELQLEREIRMAKLTADVDAKILKATGDANAERIRKRPGQEREDNEVERDIRIIRARGQYGYVGNYGYAGGGYSYGTISGYNPPSYPANNYVAYNTVAQQNVGPTGRPAAIYTANNQVQLSGAPRASGSPSIYTATVSVSQGGGTQRGGTPSNFVGTTGGR